MQKTEKFLSLYWVCPTCASFNTDRIIDHDTSKCSKCRSTFVKNLLFTEYTKFDANGMHTDRNKFGVAYDFCCDNCGRNNSIIPTFKVISNTKSKGRKECVEEISFNGETSPTKGTCTYCNFEYELI